MSEMIPVKRMIKIDIQTLLDKTEKKQKKKHNIFVCYAISNVIVFCTLHLL